MSSTQLQKRLFHVIESTRMAAKCTKIKNACAKLVFFCLGYYVLVIIVVNYKAPYYTQMYKPKEYSSFKWISSVECYREHCESNQLTEQYKVKNNSFWQKGNPKNQQTHSKWHPEPDSLIHGRHALTIKLAITASEE